MSVMGELARYVDALVEELERVGDPASEELRDALLVVRPTEPTQVAPCAERILRVLDESGLAEAIATGSAPAREQPEPAPALHEAVRTLTKLCRIVLGR